MLSPRFPADRASIEATPARNTTTLDAVLAGARREGHDAGQLLRSAGIVQNDDGTEAVLDDVRYVALIRLLTNLLEDEALGLFSKRFKPGSVVLVMRSALGAPSLEHALRRMAHTFFLLQDDYLPSISRSERGCCLRLKPQDCVRPSLPFAEVISIRTFWRMMEWLSGGRATVHRFEFSAADPVEPGFALSDYGDRATFGSECPAIWFASETLKHPVRRDEGSLRQFFGDAQLCIFGTPGPQALGVRVRNLLLQTQPAWHDLRETAALLNMSGSTLQRRLTAEGTSFQTLKGNLRREMALARLNAGNKPIKALAVELGFRDVPSFQRAFKSWTGVPPGKYRSSPDAKGL